jgi:diaminopropionate ammonia-lyase
MYQAAEKLSTSERSLVWPNYTATELRELPRLAELARVAHTFLKAEWQRPLGNFKSLGGMLAAMRAVTRHMELASVEELLLGHIGSKSPPSLLCASDGNHGLAVAVQDFV